MLLYSNRKLFFGLIVCCYLPILLLSDPGICPGFYRTHSFSVSCLHIKFVSLGVLKRACRPDGGRLSRLLHLCSCGFCTQFLLLPL